MQPPPAPRPGGPRRPPGALERAAWLGLALFLVLPTRFWATSATGLDASWALSVHMARVQGLVFGRDYVFPFGPLQVASTRLPVGDVHAAIAGCDLVLLAGLAWLVVSLHGALGRRAALAGALLCALCPRPFWWFSDLALVQGAVVLLLLLDFLRTRRAAPLVLAAALAIVVFLSKANTGMASALAVALVLALGVGGGLPRRLAFLGAYALALVAAARWMRVDLAGTLRATVPLVSSFEEAMFLEPQPGEGLAARLPFLAWPAVVAAWGVVLLAKRRALLARRELALGALLASGFLLVLFKHAFVRADLLHASAFLRYAPFAFGGLALLAGAPHRRAFGAALAVALAPSLLLASAHADPARLADRPAGIARYAADLAGLGERPAYDDPWSSLAPLRDLRETVGARTVDLLPYEISIVHALGLAWRPRPVVQSYQAFDGFLDGLNRARYEAPDAPELLLFTLGSVDDRYAFFDESLTKRAMRTHYGVAGTRAGFLLLERRERPLALDERPLASGTLRLGEPLAIPAGDAPRVLTLRARYSLLGRLRRLFLRPPELRVTFELDSGPTRSFRAVVPILATGVVIDPYVATLADCERYFAGAPGELARVRRVTFDSPRPWGFGDAFDYELRALEVREP